MAKDPFSLPDAAFRDMIANYSAVISAAPTSVGVLAAQATSLASLASAFDAAYSLAVNPTTRTKATVASKNVAKTAVRDYARVLARLIKAYPSITDAQLINLGLNVPGPVSPINPPEEPPVMEIGPILGRTVSVRLRGLGADGRGRPPGVYAANVYSYVGTTPPSDVNQYKLEGETTRNDFDVEFPATLAPGTQVWLSCCWKNPRLITGPACTPQTLYLGGGLEMAA